ncbi:MAG: hypothetical protein HYS14_02745 [Candidatus Rokubacteria bacterium]|nr:hypothetical protein [Candidatus Rokubacteria bacterium]
MTASTLAALGCERILALAPREQRALRDAVEAEARRRRFFHRRTGGARPTPHPIALTPFVIPKRLTPVLHRLAHAVHRFQARAPELYLRRVEDFRDLCPLDEVTEAWLFRYGHPLQEVGDLLIRLDVGLTSGGAHLQPVLYETNSTALAGLFNHSVGVQILRGLVFPRLFSQRELRGLQDPPDLLRLVFQWVGRSAGRARLCPRGQFRVAFVEPAGPEEGYSEIPQIVAYFRAAGIPATCGAPGRLRLREGEVVLGGRPVSLVYRDLPFGDLGPPGSGRGLAGFAELLTRGAVIPGFSGEFDQKGILECLTSEAYRGFFSARDRRLLARCVPWTRVLRERKTASPSGATADLFRYARREQDRLLIKPNQGSGGEGILLGAETSASRWERRLERAAREPGRWVVQERVRSAPTPMAYLQNGQIQVAPCYASLGLFYARDRLGLHCRVSRAPVVNVAKGGALACVFLTN